MNLLKKLTNRYIGWSLLVMLLSGIIIYFTLSVIINSQMDERLNENLSAVENQLKQMPETVFFEPGATVQKTVAATETILLSDTLIYNQNEKEFEKFRQISAIKNIGNTTYRIVLRKSKIESEDLLTTLALVTILGMVLLWIILFLVTRHVAKSLWQPFFINLNRIQHFSIHAREAVQLEKTGISEFDQLNEVIKKLTAQIITDFQNQKQFTEDVSHELQTPLAVISTRLENLLGSSELTRNRETLNSIYASVRRLSKLNRAMILLSKIENNQFASEEQSSLKTIVAEKLDEFSELIELKQLTIETEFINDFVVGVPPSLAEILISNLLSNSINHNTAGGKIQIIMNSNHFGICNSGTRIIAEPEKLFNRFYKSDPSSQSVGLGLAIVKKICDLQHLEIRYQFNENLHCFEITSQH